MLVDSSSQNPLVSSSFRDENSMLWDNGEPDGRGAFTSVDCAPAQVSTEVVDDIVVPSTWQVNSGQYYMVCQNNADPSTIDGVNVFFYQDENYQPSTQRYTQRTATFTAIATGDIFFDQYRVISMQCQFDSVELSAGRWWVCFQTVLQENSLILTTQNFAESIRVCYPEFGWPKWTCYSDYYLVHYGTSFRLYGQGEPAPFQADTNGPYTVEAGLPLLMYGSSINGEHPLEWQWEFGDGTTSPQQNPVHFYSQKGTYTINLSVIDDNGQIASDSSTVLVIKPILAITHIKGGLGVKAEITNMGDAYGLDIEWTVKVTGGVFHNIYAVDTDLVKILGPDETEKASNSLFKGFGPVTITITAQGYNADPVTVDATAFVIGPFIIGLTEEIQGES